MQLTFVTGASRGIGASLAQHLLKSGHQVIGMSRTANSDLAAAFPDTYKEVRADIGQPEAARTAFVEELLSWKSRREGLAEVNLIHNAATLEPVRQIGTGSYALGMRQAIETNLLGPMMLTEAFVGICQEWATTKRVMMVSSGAGRKPKAAWSSYCTSKAAVDMYARCLAEEQQGKAFPVRATSVAPGVVDTMMQQFIRSHPEEILPGVKRFKDLKASGNLWSTEKVASGLAMLLSAPGYGKEVILDLRDFMK
ncbi:MAG: SDR family NAD(P)-dependent oxidoreductase [Bacteroidota bacterium]